MQFRLATFNLNNLFQRPKLLQLAGFSPTARPVLEDIDRLTALLALDSYAGQTGQDIVALLKKYGFASGKGNEWFDLNQAKGKLFSVSKQNGLSLRVGGRGDWLGWVELTGVTVDDEASRNTGRVIAAARADILGVVEAESRPALDRFNQQVLRPQHADFPHVLLIDGNDPRGIDVGLYSRHEIRSVRSHVDDSYTDTAGHTHTIFSRDCPEFEIALPGNKTLWWLANHFKSQGYGTPAANDARRLKQTARVREILGRYNLKKDWVVVAGDFNANPQSASLQPLLTVPHLRDVFAWPGFQGQPRWTYHAQKQQLDYLLVSDPLFAALQGVGVERRGMLVKNEPHFAQVTGPQNEASDHAALWAEFNL